MTILFLQQTTGITFIKPLGLLRSYFIYACKLPYNQMSFWQLETVQHCLSAVKRVLTFTDCILVTLNVNDDDVYYVYVIMVVSYLILNNLSQSAWNYVFNAPVHYKLKTINSLTSSKFGNIYI